MSLGKSVATGIVLRQTPDRVNCHSRIPDLIRHTFYNIHPHRHNTKTVLIFSKPSVARTATPFPYTTLFRSPVSPPESKNFLSQFLPEADFKYFSLTRPPFQFSCLSVKIIFQCKCPLVNLLRPALCSAKRLTGSIAIPVYQT